MTSRRDNRRITEGEGSGDVLHAGDLDQRLLMVDRGGRVTLALEPLAQAIAALLVVQGGVVVVQAGSGSGGSLGTFRQNAGSAQPLTGGTQPGRVQVARPRAGRQESSGEAGVVFEGAGSFGAVPDPVEELDAYLRDDGTWVNLAANLATSRRVAADTIVTVPSGTGRVVPVDFTIEPGGLLVIEADAYLAVV